MSECGICNERYNDGARTPRMLPCAHTFCLECLQRQAAGPGPLVCALCQRQAALPAGGAPGFPRNFALLDMMAAGQQAGSAGAGPGPGAAGDPGLETACKVCGDEELDVVAAATHSCQDCGAMLCTGHSMVHDKTKATKGHRVRGLAGVVCGDHANGMLDLYCRPHARPVCRDCCLFDHRACDVAPLKVGECGCVWRVVVLCRLPSHRISFSEKDSNFFRARSSGYPCL